MTFCGQCGYQLAPGMTTCPRCGSVTEAQATHTQGGETYGDNPTIASQSYALQNPAGPVTPNNQQRLILRPGADNGPPSYGQDATSRVDATGFAPQQQQQGYMTQGGGAYPPQGASYPGFASQPGLQQQFQSQYQQQQEAIAQERLMEQEARSSRGRVTGLVLILLGLLFILSAVILFTLQHNASQSNTPPTTPISTTTGVVAPTDQARQVIQSYYDSINQQNYQQAYNLWQNNPQTYQQFQNGFKNTKHDTLSITDTNQQPDGTVRVAVNIKATEKASGNSEKTTIFNGYYIVKQQSSGTWKIIDGQLQQM